VGLACGAAFWNLSPGGQPRPPAPVVPLQPVPLVGGQIQVPAPLYSNSVATTVRMAMANVAITSPSASRFLSVGALTGPSGSSVLLITRVWDVVRLPPVLVHGVRVTFTLVGRMDFRSSLRVVPLAPSPPVRSVPSSELHLLHVLVSASLVPPGPCARPAAVLALHPGLAPTFASRSAEPSTVYSTTAWSDSCRPGTSAWFQRGEHQPVRSPMNLVGPSCLVALLWGRSPVDHEGGADSPHLDIATRSWRSLAVTLHHLARLDAAL